MALIQPFGCHIQLSNQLRIVAVAENVASFVPGKTFEGLLDQPMTALASSSAVHALRNRMALLRSDTAAEQLFECSLVEGGDPFDITIRRRGDGFAIDLEPASPRSGDAVAVLAAQLDCLERCADLSELGKRAADEFRALTGADQVAVFFGTGPTASSGRSGQQIKLPGRAPPAASTIVDCDLAPVRVVGKGMTDVAGSELAQADAATLSWLTSTGAKSAMLLKLPRGAGDIACLHATARRLSLERRCMARLLGALVAMHAEMLSAASPNRNSRERG